MIKLQVEREFAKVFGLVGYGLKLQRRRRMSWGEGREKRWKPLAFKPNGSITRTRYHHCEDEADRREKLCRQASPERSHFRERIRRSKSKHLYEVGRSRILTGDLIRRRRKKTFCFSYTASQEIRVGGGYDLISSPTGRDIETDSKGLGEGGSAAVGRRWMIGGIRPASAF